MINAMIEKIKQEPVSEYEISGLRELADKAVQTVLEMYQ